MLLGALTCTAVLRRRFYHFCLGSLIPAPGLGSFFFGSGLCASLRLGLRVFVGGDCARARVVVSFGRGVAAGSRAPCRPRCLPFALRVVFFCWACWLFLPFPVLASRWVCLSVRPPPRGAREGALVVLAFRFRASPLPGLHSITTTKVTRKISSDDLTFLQRSPHVGSFISVISLVM